MITMIKSLAFAFFFAFVNFMTVHDLIEWTKEEPQDHFVLIFLYTDFLFLMLTLLVALQTPHYARSMFLILLGNSFLIILLGVAMYDNTSTLHDPFLLACFTLYTVFTLVGFKNIWEDYFTPPHMQQE